MGCTLPYDLILPISNQGNRTDFLQSSYQPVPPLEKISAPFKMTNVIQMFPVTTGKGRLLGIKHFLCPIYADWPN